MEVKRIDYGDLDVADALLSHAANSDVDFIVLGGYGHSRLREFVLGGVKLAVFCARSDGSGADVALSAINLHLASTRGK